MLEAIQFPARVPGLHPSLTNVNRNHFTHRVASSNAKIERKDKAETRKSVSSVVRVRADERCEVAACVRRACRAVTIDLLLFLVVRHARVVTRCSHARRDACACAARRVRAHEYLTSRDAFDATRRARRWRRTRRRARGAMEKSKTRQRVYKKIIRSRATDVTSTRARPPRPPRRARTRTR